MLLVAQHLFGRLWSGPGEKNGEKNCSTVNRPLANYFSMYIALTILYETLNKVSTWVSIGQDLAEGEDFHVSQDGLN